MDTEGVEGGHYNADARVRRFYRYNDNRVQEHQRRRWVALLARVEIYEDSTPTSGWCFHKEDGY